VIFQWKIKCGSNRKRTQKMYSLRRIMELIFIYRLKVGPEYSPSRGWNFKKDIYLKTMQETSVTAY